MKLLGKRVVGEATAWSDVHSLRLHSTVHEVPFKTACRFCIAHHWNFVYWTLLLLRLSRTGLPFYFSTCTQQVAFLKDIMYICYKNNQQQIFIFDFSTGINICSFASFRVFFFFFFPHLFYSLPKKVLPHKFWLLWSPWDLIHDKNK